MLRIVTYITILLDDPNRATRTEMPACYKKENIMLVI